MARITTATASSMIRWKPAIRSWILTATAMGCGRAIHRSVGNRKLRRGRRSALDQMLVRTCRANGTLAEPISFDYTNGHEEPLCVILANQIKTLGGVRNLESQGRQLFARHLYCLMLLLVDDNYIAPWDENNAQLMAWMTAEKAKLTTATNPTADTGGGRLRRKAQSHMQDDRPMGGELRRHARSGRDLHAVRI